MKTFLATLILAIGLAAPAAVGQSQGIQLNPVRQMGAAPAELVQVSTQALSGRSLASFERSGGEERTGILGKAPDPLVSWAMAIVFLGLVVMRRTRSPMP